MSFKVGQTVYVVDNSPAPYRGLPGLVVHEGNYHNGCKYLVTFESPTPGKPNIVEVYKPNGVGSWLNITAEAPKKWYAVYRAVPHGMLVYPQGYNTEAALREAFKSGGLELVHCFQA